MNTSSAAPEQPVTSTEQPAPDAGPEPADPAGPGVVRRADSDRRTAYRALAVALACGVLGASLVLLAAGKTWAHGTASSAGHAMPVHAGGSQMTALPGALALVGLASLVAIFAVRRVGRYVVAALLTLSGLGAAVTALTRRGDHGALDSAAATATSLTHATAAHTSTTGWPFVSVAGGLLLLLAGLIALRHGSRWPAMSSRYDRPGVRAARASAPPVVDPDRPEDLWKALDRGEDPTEDPAGGHADKPAAR
ncbi:TIGR02234 family membrane protein [Streptomyces sp. NBC_00448]